MDPRDLIKELRDVLAPRCVILGVVLLLAGLAFSACDSGFNAPSLSALFFGS